MGCAGTAGDDASGTMVAGVAGLVVVSGTVVVGVDDAVVLLWCSSKRVGNGREVCE